MSRLVIKLKTIEWKLIPNTNCSASSMGQIRNDLTQEILVQSENGKGYLEVSSVGLPTSLVHRLVALAFHENPWNLPLVDHKNRIRNDNRSCNLMWANNSMNMLNRPKKQNTTSKYYGVTKTNKKWKAYLYVDGKSVSLGSFATEQEAGQAYNDYVTENKLPNQLNIMAFST